MTSNDRGSQNIDHLLNLLTLLKGYVAYERGLHLVECGRKWPAGIQFLLLSYYLSTATIYWLQMNERIKTSQWDLRESRSLKICVEKRVFMMMVPVSLAKDLQNIDFIVSIAWILFQLNNSGIDKSDEDKILI